MNLKLKCIKNKQLANTQINAIFNLSLFSCRQLLASITENNPGYTSHAVLPLPSPI